jgi:hypothetical protein
LSDTKPPPYPADTRARGWRFELDYEAIEQSTTWTRAKPEARPWLLMLWMVSWKQVPCGSLPDDHEAIAGAIGAPDALWKKHQAALLRGWWRCDDGRLYHDTVTKRVLEMLEYRRKEAARRAGNRGKTPTVPRDTAGTPTGLPPDDTGSPDTGTGTGTIGGIEPGGSTPPGSGATHSPDGEYIADDQPLPGLRYAEIAGAIRRAGLSALDPGYPLFRALVDHGAEEHEFLALVPDALTKDQPFKWLIGAVSGERKRVLKLRGEMHRGAMPNKQEALENRNRSVADEWAKEMANGSR